MNIWVSYSPAFRRGVADYFLKDPIWAYMQACLHNLRQVYSLCHRLLLPEPPKKNTWGVCQENIIAT